jgi:anaerobic dimethyl sulfoxide reductase subunit B
MTNMQYGFYLDTSRCIGCKACTVACMDWNDIKPGIGVQWRRVTSFESGTGTNIRLTNVSLSCMHCAKPACESVCPVRAVTKRVQDGIVVVDQSKCIGCRLCAMACPFGTPQFGADGTMQKCNLCLDRVTAGLLPECVSSCTGGALHAGSLDELTKMAQAKIARQLAGATQPSLWIK